MRGGPTGGGEVTRLSHRWTGLFRWVVAPLVLAAVAALVGLALALPAVQGWVFVLLVPGALAAFQVVPVLAARVVDLAPDALVVGGEGGEVVPLAEVDGVDESRWSRFRVITVTAGRRTIRIVPEPLGPYQLGVWERHWAAEALEHAVAAARRRAGAS